MKPQNFLPRSYFGDISGVEAKAYLVELRRLCRSGVYSNAYLDLVKRSVTYYFGE